jgi:hypothetical protein
MPPPNSGANGDVWITATGATNATHDANLRIHVVVNVQRRESFVPSFGHVDIPVDRATGLSGAFPVSGWALDDVEVSRVQVWRDPVSFDPQGAIASNGKVYIGEAIFVEGARPDVAALNGTLPRNDRAGWGMLVLSNMLPDVAKRTPAGGNGTFKLTITATDAEGHITTLGTRTVTVNNAQAVRPFGTIDRPTPGATMTGVFPNFGWALARPGRMIPTNGSTIWAWVDGVPVGHPVYNLCRAAIVAGKCTDDIATLFPGYANSNGAIGYYLLDTTTLTNGLHTISWSVKDDAGNSEGIGSRYFRVLNGPSSSRRAMQMSSADDIGTRFDQRAAGVASVSAALGYDPSPATQKVADGRVRMPQAGSLTVQVAPGASTASVYRFEGGTLGALPVGATYDASTRRLAWQPGPAFLGQYPFAVVERMPGGAKRVSTFTVEIAPSVETSVAPSAATTALIEEEPVTSSGPTAPAPFVDATPAPHSSEAGARRGAPIPVSLAGPPPIEPGVGARALKSGPDVARDGAGLVGESTHIETLPALLSEEQAYETLRQAIGAGQADQGADGGCEILTTTARSAESFTIVRRLQRGDGCQGSSRAGSAPERYRVDRATGSITTYNRSERQWQPLAAVPAALTR